jgi:hypothetical protein
MSRMTDLKASARAAAARALTHLHEGFVERCLERIGEDVPNEERIFRDLWEDDT